MKKLTILSMGAALALAASAVPVMASGSSGTGNFSVQLVSDQVAYDQLPQQVKSTIQAQAPNETIHSIKAETKKGETVYKVEFQRRAGKLLHPELVINSQGALLKEKHMANAANEPAGAENK